MTFLADLSKKFEEKKEKTLKNLDSGICKIHNRKLELICLQEKTRICADCALFGDHKGHEIIQFKQAVQQEEASLNEILSAALKLKSSIKSVKNKEGVPSSFQSQVLETCAEKRAELELSLRSKFEEIRKEIDNAQKRLMENINEHVDQVESWLRDLLKEGTPTLTRAEEKFEIILDFLESHTDTDKLNMKLLTKNNGSEEMTKLCAELEQDIDRYKAGMELRLEDRLSEYKLFVQRDLLKGVAGVVRFGRYKRVKVLSVDGGPSAVKSNSGKKAFFGGSGVDLGAGRDRLEEIGGCFGSQGDSALQEMVVPRSPADLASCGSSAIPSTSLVRTQVKGSVMSHKPQDLKVYRVNSSQKGVGLENGQMLKSQSGGLARSDGSADGSLYADLRSDGSPGSLERDTKNEKFVNGFSHCYFNHGTQGASRGQNKVERGTLGGTTSSQRLMLSAGEFRTTGSQKSVQHKNGLLLASAVSTKKFASSNQARSTKRRVLRGPGERKFGQKLKKSKNQPGRYIQSLLDKYDLKDRDGGNGSYISSQRDGKENFKALVQKKKQKLKMKIAENSDPRMVLGSQEISVLNYEDINDLNASLRKHHQRQKIIIRNNQDLGNFGRQLAQNETLSASVITNGHGNHTQRSIASQIPKMPPKVVSSLKKRLAQKGRFKANAKTSRTDKTPPVLAKKHRKRKMLESYTSRERFQLQKNGSFQASQGDLHISLEVTKDACRDFCAKGIESDRILTFRDKKTQKPKKSKIAKNDYFQSTKAPVELFRHRRSTDFVVEEAQEELDLPKKRPNRALFVSEVNPVFEVSQSNSRYQSDSMEPLRRQGNASASPRSPKTARRKIKDLIAGKISNEKIRHKTSSAFYKSHIKDAGKRLKARISNCMKGSKKPKKAQKIKAKRTDVILKRLKKTTSEVIDLSNCHKNGDKMMSEIRFFLGKNPKLKILKLRGNCITNRGAIQLIGFLMQRQIALDYLDMSNNLITELFLEKLLEFENLMDFKVKKLDLSDCGIVLTDSRVAKLRRQVRQRGLNVAV